MMRRKLQTVGWIAALLCCAVLWATPAVAQQAYNLWIGGVQVTSENCNYIDKEHGFEGVTIADGGECRYDNEVQYLT